MANGYGKKTVRVRKPKSTMLGTGMAGRAGRAMEKAGQRKSRRLGEIMGKIRGM